jgi:propanol-preferring alcohol dehydrogenase
MRAAVLDDYKTDPVIRDVPVPQPGPGEVLVRVAACGLCHSDLHLRDGELPLLPSFPWILGHEIAGWVETAPAGSHVSIGEPVLVFGGWGCGSCRVCRSGQEQLCSTAGWVGIGRPGGFAEFVSVPSARHLVPLGGLDPVQAAPLADAALTPYHAVRRVLPDLYPGSTTLLVGAGGLGQYGVQLLRALSPTRVVVVDTDPAKREQALHLGAHEAFHPDEVPATLRGTAAASLDFVGTTPSLRLAVDALDRRGTLVIVGLAGGALPVGFLSQAPEASVTTSYWGTHQDLVEVVALAGAGRIGGTVHERDLAAVGTAMTDLRAGHVDGRIVLVP